MLVIFFFKQKTAYEMRISDWSSDVCSSDLLEPEQSPAVVDEVEFGIAPAPDQLRLALGLGEGQAHAAAHDLREDVEERLADRLRQLEIADRKSTRLNSSH